MGSVLGCDSTLGGVLLVMQERLKLEQDTPITTGVLTVAGDAWLVSEDTCQLPSVGGSLVECQYDEQGVCVGFVDTEDVTGGAWNGV